MSNINDEVDNYFNARQAVFDHVGYRERWRDFPLDDSRDQYWSIQRDEIKFSPDRDALIYWLTNDDYGVHGDKLYSNVIVRSSDIYRGAELTAIVADTQTDGNVFLQILSNENEVTL